MCCDIVVVKIINISENISLQRVEGTSFYSILSLSVNGDSHQKSIPVAPGKRKEYTLERSTVHQYVRACTHTHGHTRTHSRQVFSLLDLLI